MKRNLVLIWTRIFMLVLFASLLTPISARADVAPPEQPPGTNIVPGSESTQVRMVAETVTLRVLSSPSVNYPGQAKTEAVFMMRNLGQAEEKMEVRFPLTFFNNQSDGFGNFPEIPDIQILVNGKAVSTHRIEADFTNPGGGITFSRAPWAAFNVSFPPGEDVIITVKYMANGYGYEPYFALRYILETGAGWNDTIGTVDIIVKLPYEANPKNVVVDETTGFSTTTAGAQFSDSEVRWHFENLEPTSENNIEISLLQTTAWQKALDYTEYVRKYPNDGEGWGQLGKAYKEIVRFPKFFRSDPAGVEMYQLSAQAYEKAVTFLPDDALWHYGFADLLWSHYYFQNFFGETRDIPALVQAVDELRKSLALDPKNQNARDLADWIAGTYPWAISRTDKGYDFPVLTATPTLAPDVSTPLPEPSSTPAPLPAPTLTALPVAETASPEPAKTPSPELPVCGGAALLPVLAGLAWLIAKRH